MTPRHSYRWGAARHGTEAPRLRHRGRMRPLIFTVVTAALLTGCMSVPATDSPPAPQHAPATHPAPAPPAVPVPPAAPAPYSDELTKIEASPSAAAKKRTAPAKAAPPRRARPYPRRTYRAPAPRRAQPRTPGVPRVPSGGMRSVCRAAQGVTSPSLAALCRNAWGR